MALCLLISLILPPLLIWFFIKQDGDLILMLAEKFGKSKHDLKGKVVWISGSSSGIGRALAIELASVGCKLALSDIDVSKLEETRALCLKKNGRLIDSDVLALPLNINEFNKHNEALATVVENFGHLDILVNNGEIY